MFYPAIYFEENITLCNGIDIVIGQTPLGFLTVGNSAVMAFLLITGFGTYIMSATASEEKKTKFWMLRFIKMFIMIWTAVLFVWILIKGSLIYEQEVALQTKSLWLQGWEPVEQNLLKLLTYSVFDVGNMYNDAFWTMYFIFEASFIVLLIHSLVAKKKRPLFYISFIFIIFFCLKSLYFLPVVMGCFLAEYYLKHQESQMKNRIGSIVFLLAVFFWSFPSIVRSGYMYDFLPKGLEEGYHMLGALLLIISALYWKPVERIMKCGALQWLAKKSMAIYVLHFGILVSFSSWCYKILIGYFEHNGAAMITLSVTIAVLGVSVWLYDKVMYIVYNLLDRVCTKVIYAIDE